MLLLGSMSVVAVDVVIELMMRRVKMKQWRRVSRRKEMSVRCHHTTQL